MTTTRTQQKLLDKETDFNRKDENDSKVTIIKKWGDPDRFLDQHFNNREKWDNLNKYNLLYVLQNVVNVKLFGIMVFCFYDYTDCGFNQYILN